MEVLDINNVLLVVPDGNNGIQLDIALANQTKPFFLYGVPKKLKKYIMSKTNNYIYSKIKTKYKNLKALVQLPNVGNLIDISHYKEKEEEWFESSTYIMNLEEALIYKKYFPNSNFFPDESTKFLLNSLSS